MDLRYDPLPILISSPNAFVRLRAQIEFKGASRRALNQIWNNPQVRKILSKQKKDGSWKYPGRRAGPEVNYEYVETYRILGWLVEKYCMGRGEAGLEAASEFLLSLQSSEGDIRGIYGKQYFPNYTADVLELLVKAGYERDERIKKGFEWLMSMRLEDGGWAVPLRTVGWKFYEAMPQEAVQPDRSKPFSHLITGVVLRAFAAHPGWRRSSEAQHAARLLLSRFFTADKYPDRSDPSYWIKFRFPFWFTDLLSSMDSLALMGFSPDEPSIRKGIAWFAERQREDGSWRLSYLGCGDMDVDQWVTFAICRALKQFHDLSATHE